MQTLDKLQSGTKTAGGKVVVTGAAGFIGSHIVKALVKSGVPPQQIVVVDKPVLFTEHKCAFGFGKQGMQMIDLEEFPSFLENEPGIQCVYHMGAISNTEEMREDLLRKQNLAYSTALWALCLQKKISFIYASSAATYGGGEHGFSDDPALVKKLKPLNPYGWSKQKFDEFVLSEQANGTTPPVWAGLKFFNVYGPGEEHKGSQSSVVWHVRNQLRDKGIAQLFRSHKEGIADGHQKRDFVWIGDVVKVCLAFGSGKLTPGIYNVGSGKARTFLDLLHATAKALGTKPTVKFVDTPTLIRDKYQYWTEANLTNLRKAGYKEPFTELEVGVDAYIKIVGRG